MTTDGKKTTRRRVLQVSGVAALTGFAAVPSAADGSTDGGLNDEKYCDQTSLRPDMVHYDGSMEEVCDDDHPESQAIQEDVKKALEDQYPTVGSLIDKGFIPYFDFFDGGEWSHWINPEFIGDDKVMDPDKPESILVDHTYWRPIGVMFVATVDGEPMEEPPSVYHDDAVADYGGNCTPWHAHVGLPGRISWWKYDKVYGEGGTLPCRTPWMLHVWNYDHEQSIYAHGAPEERGGPPAEEPGFKTDADPNEEELGPKHLPDAVLDKAKEML